MHFPLLLVELLDSSWIVLGLLMTVLLDNWTGFANDHFDSLDSERFPNECNSTKWRTVQKDDQKREQPLGNQHRAAQCDLHRVTCTVWLVQCDSHQSFCRLRNSKLGMCGGVWLLQIVKNSLEAGLRIKSPFKSLLKRRSIPRRSIARDVRDPLEVACCDKRVASWARFADLQSPERSEQSVTIDKRIPKKQFLSSPNFRTNDLNARFCSAAILQRSCKYPTRTLQGTYKDLTNCNRFSKLWAFSSTKSQLKALQAFANYNLQPVANVG